MILQFLFVAGVVLFLQSLTKEYWLAGTHCVTRWGLELGSDSRMQHQNHQRRNLINWIPSKWETCSKDTAKGIKRQVWGREAETRRAVSPPSFPPILHLSLLHLLLHSDRGRLPMGVNKAWPLSWSRTKFLSLTKAGRGNPARTLQLYTKKTNNQIKNRQKV